MFKSFLILSALLCAPFAIKAQPNETKSNAVPVQQDDEFGRGTRVNGTETLTVRNYTREVSIVQAEAKNPETKPERKKEIEKVISQRTAAVDKIDSHNTGETADPALKQETAAFALQTGDIPKAAGRAEQAVALSEKTKDPALLGSALKTRALTYAAAGDNEKANADAQRVLALNPKDEEAAIIEKLTGRHAKEKKLDMTAQKQPGAELAHLMEKVRASAPVTRSAGFEGSVGYTKDASNALKLGDWEEVHRKATLALEKLPRNPKARLERATAGIKLGRLDEAIADATAGLADKPNSPALLSVRAAAQNEAGRPKEALADAGKALEINPKHAFAWLQKGLAREKLGEPDDQYLEDFKTAAELDPDLENEYASALTRRKDGRRSADKDKKDETGLSKKTAVAIGGAALSAGLLALLAAALLLRRKPRPAAAKLGPGDVIGGSFKLGPVIGMGGMGHVYEAWDQNLERAVAIKRLSEKLRDDPQEAEALIREAKTVAGLKHPNIVAIYDAFKEGGEAYLVFELVKGETLYDYVQRKGGKLSKDAALRILGAICLALDYAHERRVIHRDLKPTNVMLEDGHVKVMDFGIARRMKTDGVLTMTSRVVGTPPFMAPEQQFGEVSRESDLYALAVCAYHMLSGALPFEGDSAQALKLEGRFTPLAERLPGSGAGVDAVFARAFAVDRAKRFHSGAEFFGALRDAL